MDPPYLEERHASLELLERVVARARGVLGSAGVVVAPQVTVGRPETEEERQTSVSFHSPPPLASSVALEVEGARGCFDWKLHAALLEGQGHWNARIFRRLRLGAVP